MESLYGLGFIMYTFIIGIKDYQRRRRESGSFFFFASEAEFCDILFYQYSLGYFFFILCKFDLPLRFIIYAAVFFLHQIIRIKIDKVHHYRSKSGIKLYTRTL